MFILEKIELLVAIYGLSTVTILATHCVNITHRILVQRGQESTADVNRRLDLRLASRPPYKTEGWRAKMRRQSWWDKVVMVEFNDHITPSRCFIGVMFNYKFKTNILSANHTAAPRPRLPPNRRENRQSPTDNTPALRHWKEQQHHFELQPALRHRALTRQTEGSNALEGDEERARAVSWRSGAFRLKSVKEKRTTNRLTRKPWVAWKRLSPNSCE